MNRCAEDLRIEGGAPAILGMFGVRRCSSSALLLMLLLLRLLLPLPLLLLLLPLKHPP